MTSSLSTSGNKASSTTATTDRVTANAATGTAYHLNTSAYNIQTNPTASYFSRTAGTDHKAATAALRTKEATSSTTNNSTSASYKREEKTRREERKRQEGRTRDQGGKEDLGEPKKVQGLGEPKKVQDLGEQKKVQSAHIRYFKKATL